MSGVREKVTNDPVTNGRPVLLSQNCSYAEFSSPSAIITDPPYVGNVNYAELADFFYVWLRLALKDTYSLFAPEYTPKSEEIGENKTRGKTRKDFFASLLVAF